MRPERVDVSAWSPADPRDDTMSEELMDTTDWNLILDDLLRGLSVPKGVSGEEIWKICERYFASG